MFFPLLLLHAGTCCITYFCQVSLEADAAGELPSQCFGHLLAASAVSDSWSCFHFQTVVNNNIKGTFWRNSVDIRFSVKMNCACSSHCIFCLWITYLSNTCYVCLHMKIILMITARVFQFHGKDLELSMMISCCWQEDNLWLTLAWELAHIFTIFDIRFI